MILTRRSTFLPRTGVPLLRFLSSSLLALLKKPALTHPSQSASAGQSAALSVTTFAHRTRTLRAMEPLP